MNSVSFGSTFKVSSKNNDYNRQSKFIDYGMKKYGDSMEFRDIDGGKRVITVVAPDSKDSSIESFCAYNGIKYTKIPADYLLSAESINLRVRPAQGNMVMGYLNVDKLEELAKTQENNFEHCEKDYKKYFRKETDRRLLSGNMFSASSFHIEPMSNKKDLMHYIDTFGADRLNKDMINMTIFSLENDENEQCVYAALKDKGFRHIPVYMYPDTYDIASKLGILEDGIQK